MQTKFHVSRSNSFREKFDDHFKIASYFSPILSDRGTWNFFSILTHMDTICKPNLMFLGHTVYENAMISCKNSKFHIRPNKQLSKFYKLASHFSLILWDRGTWNFFCILTHICVLCKPNFMFLGHTVFVKNAMISWKNSKLLIRPDKQLCNFTSYHRIFLRYCVTEELEIFFVY